MSPLRDPRDFTDASQLLRGSRQGAGSTLDVMNDLRATTSAPVLDIAVPVYNEERVLDTSIRALHAHVCTRIPFATRITIVDNASEDATRLIGMRLAVELDGVRFVHLGAKGRGRAIRAVWMASEARVLAYMDVDLSTRLEVTVGLDRAAARGRQRHHHRQPAHTRCAGHQGPTARGHLARLQPPASGRAAHALSRCAVRIQGDTRAGRPRPGAHGS